MPSTPRGGASPYRRGAAYERKGAEVLRGLGFLVVRQPKSQSPFDLIAVRSGEVWLVQAKLGGRLRPQEREELVALAEEHGAVPVLQKDRPTPRFYHVVTGEVLA